MFDWDNEESDMTQIMSWPEGFAALGVHDGRVGPQRGGVPVHPPAHGTRPGLVECELPLALTGLTLTLCQEIFQWKMKKIFRCHSLTACSATCFSLAAAVRRLANCVGAYGDPPSLSLGSEKVFSFPRASRFFKSPPKYPSSFGIFSWKLSLSLRAKFAWKGGRRGEPSWNWVRILCNIGRDSSFMALLGTDSEMGEDDLLADTDGGDTDLLGEQFTGDKDRSSKYVGETDVTFFSSCSALTVFPRAVIRLETPRAVAMSVTADSLAAGTWHSPVYRNRNTNIRSARRVSGRMRW